MRLLTVNAGSSSLKLTVLGPGDELLQRRDLPALGAVGEGDALGEALLELGDCGAVVHRVVHGGRRFLGPTLLDAAVEREIEALGELAPLHQPPALSAIRATRARLPQAPQVACFDTAFHQGLPAEASTYAVPGGWRERFGLRRYGFHGLAHAYLARRAAELLGRPPGELRLVTCQLGSGASLCAVAKGRSVDTTMGFTPLAGLVMATRCGDLDPGLVLFLAERLGKGPEELLEVLERGSGLLALGGDSDLQRLLGARAEGDPLAELAVGVYLHRLSAAVAAMAAALRGLDALVFSGGVGENSAEIRAGCSERLAFLGVELDQYRNQRGRGDREIGSGRAGVRTLVVESREDLEMAREARALLEGGVGPDEEAAREPGGQAG